MNKVILITGASSGFGYELAKLFAKDHYDLLLVARSKDILTSLKKELEEDYKIQVHCLFLDLIKEESVNILVKYTEENNLIVTKLINNAGFGDYGDFINSSLDKQINMIKLNDVTLVNLTHRIANHMKSNNGGTIFNIASTAAFQSGPMMSTYFASKAFVLSFSEAISYELEKDNIKVITYCPGPTKTKFIETSNSQKSGIFKRFKNANPIKVSNHMYKYIYKKKKVVIYGFTNKLLAFSNRLFPRSLVCKVIYKLQTK